VRFMGHTGRMVSVLAIGAVLLILAVAGFVVVPEHAPHYVGGHAAIDTKVLTCEAGGQGTDARCEREAGYRQGNPAGLSQPMYDLLRITTWALLIVGLIAVVAGLITAWRTPRAVAE
jgi:hypothetical protein